ncbi:hypothetical protein CIPAW_12G061000 [Carya illinoinensis]|uniref:Uncharacterized protein n=1 Tax=Carya illinoinensis TaxID=32201 RepID=A0A8T1NU16_CARIL|nr:hypothetical protein CIPAW_12G061000 [Carya illinoinensis]KAG6633628.1 hypothetical protein CIPAW_12G061000 [Carya illinoinensis]
MNLDSCTEAHCLRGLRSVPNPLLLQLHCVHFEGYVTKQDLEVLTVCATDELFCHRLNMLVGWMDGWYRPEDHLKFCIEAVELHRVFVGFVLLSFIPHCW